jgi:2-dehydro-3-deoxygalactonokinase
MDEGPFDGEAFDTGVAHASGSAGLLHSAFSVRTLSLFERLPEAKRLSYLSGIVIGEELRTRSLEGAGTVIVIGSDALTLRYERALAQRGVRTMAVGSQAAWRGLHEIARTIDT